MCLLAAAVRLLARCCVRWSRCRCHRQTLSCCTFFTVKAFDHDLQGKSLTRFKHRTFFVSNDMRAAVKQGMVEYVPMSVARVPDMILLGRIPVDVALVQVSPPDEFGYVSLGVSVDIIPAALTRARLVIAEVNPAMPRTLGDSTVHISRIHHLVAVDTPDHRTGPRSGAGTRRAAHCALHRRHH
jgi:acyl-CoA hydrolase